MRLMNNEAARLDARAFAAMLPSETNDKPAYEQHARIFLRDTINDPGLEVRHIVWISEAMVSGDIEVDAAAAQLRRIRDTREMPADSRFRAARAIASLSPEDQAAAEELLAAPPPDAPRTMPSGMRPGPTSWKTSNRFQPSWPAPNAGP
jgi:hypothetical protein